MITCMGLVVGTVTTPHQQDLYNTCAQWLKNNPHLHNLRPVFEVEGQEYCMCLDVCTDGDFCVLFENLSTGFAGMGVA